MKYPRGTVLKWTAKALDPKREGSAQRNAHDRMIVLSHDEVIFIHKGVAEQLDMYKTQDSYVCIAALETVPRAHVDKAEVQRCNADCLVSEFKLVVTSKYEGRRA